jgi:pyruvate kinase
VPAQNLAGDEALSKVLIAGEDWQLVGEGYGFTDAACADAGGNFYFSDLRKNVIHRVSPDGKVSAFLENGPSISGLKFGPDGRLYAATQAPKKQIIAFAPDTKAITVLAEDVQPGDIILIDDGRVVLRVQRIQEGRVLCTIVQTGTVRDHAGVHLPSRSLRVSTLTEKDKADLSFGLSLDIDYVALSFVRSSEDVRLVRAICEAWGRPTPIVAKIETPAAVDDLEGIIASADAIMIARGDLGVEFPPERVPVIQKQILGLARIYQRPVIVATEMLQSMVHATRPTRAEASDVANAVFDGTDAVMLSAETATGDHPDLAASMMARIILEAESSRFYSPGASHAGDAVTIPEAIARAACVVAREVKARALVAFTETGSSARFVSKARPHVPIFAFSPNETTRRRLALYWGVVPLSIDPLRDADAMVERANAFVLANGLASPGDKIVVVFGAPVGVSGTTNAVQVRVLG